MYRKWIVLFISLMLLAAGCNSKEEAQKHKSKEVDGVIKEEVPEREAPFNFPLTGLGTEKEAKVRAVAVVVNNHPLARPQSGLDQADLVYEALAEGNVTRFLAVFQSEKPENIGPVRSARDYYVKLAKGYDSFFVAHGYSPDAKNMLLSGYIDHINGMNYDGTLFKRASFRKAPHNSYITYENILKGAEKTKKPMGKAPSSLAFLSRDEIKQLDGEDAGSVMISYHDPSFDVIYEFDREAGKYKRFSGGEQAVNYGSEKPILIDNIFIVEMDHRTIDKAGRRDIDIKSGGRGFLLQKGIVREVEWKNIDGKILPVANGKDAGLVPGKTWINIVPSQSGLDESVSFEAK